MTARKQRVSSGFKSAEPDYEKFQDILYRMMNGQALTTICAKEDEPDYSVFINWTAHDPEWFKEYARARQIQADYFADHIVAIADTETDQQRSRNRMDARRWHASKIAPRKYGERIMNDVNAQLNTNIKVDLSNLDRDARAKLKEALLQQMGAPAGLIEDATYKVNR